MDQNSRIIRSKQSVINTKTLMEKNIPKTSKKQLNRNADHGRDEQSHENDSDKRATQTDHYKKYEQIFKTIDFVAAITGIKLREKQKVNFWFLLTAFCVLYGHCMIFYTIYLVRNDLKALIEVVGVLGATLPGSLKFGMVMTKRKKMMSTNVFMEKLLKNTPSGTRQADILNKEVANIFKNIKIYFFLFGLGFGIFGVYPFYAFVIEGKLVPLVKIEFVYVDQTEIKGYILGSIILMMLSVITCAGNAAFDTYFIFSVFNYGTLVSLLEENFKEYHKMWQTKDRDRDYFLKHICAKYQDVNRYTRFLNEVYRNLIFQSVSILYICLIFAVYAVLNNEWISGYGFCLFAFLQLYMTCFLGTYIEIQNERLNQIVYCSPWYEYPNNVQKIFLTLIHATLYNTTTLTIGPIAPLNIETAKIMTSNIYSYNTAMQSM